MVDAKLNVGVDPTGAEEGSRAVTRSLEDIKRSAREMQVEVERSTDAIGQKMTNFGRIGESAYNDVATAAERWASQLSDAEIADVFERLSKDTERARDRQREFAQELNRTGGSVAAFTDDTRELDDQLFRLFESIDPVFRATVRYEQGVDLLDQGLKKNLITMADYAGGVTLLDERLQNAKRAAEGTTSGIAQMGLTSQRSQFAIRSLIVDIANFNPAGAVGSLGRLGILAGFGGVAGAVATGAAIGAPILATVLGDVSKISFAWSQVERSQERINQLTKEWKTELDKVQLSGNEKAIANAHFLSEMAKEVRKIEDELLAQRRREQGGRPSMSESLSATASAIRNRLLEAQRGIALLEGQRRASQDQHILGLRGIDPNAPNEQDRLSGEMAARLTLMERETAIQGSLARAVKGSVEDYKRAEIAVRAYTQALSHFGVVGIQSKDGQQAIGRIFSLLSAQEATRVTVEFEKWKTSLREAAGDASQITKAIEGGGGEALFRAQVQNEARARLAGLGINPNVSPNTGRAAEAIAVISDARRAGAQRDQAARLQVLRDELALIQKERELAFARPAEQAAELTYLREKMALTRAGLGLTDKEIEQEARRSAVNARARVELEEMRALGQEVGSVISAGFQDIIINGNGVVDVLKSITAQLAGIAFQRSAGIAISAIFGKVATSALEGGGVMTAHGPIPLRKYSGGGVANSPQVALYGEGDDPEAYVPVPNGRIPVEIRGGGGSSIIINNEINIQGGSSGSAQQDAELAEQMGREVSRQLRNMVVEVIQNEQRAGGSLGRKI